MKITFACFLTAACVLCLAAAWPSPLAIDASGSTRTLSLAGGSMQTVTLSANCTFTLPAAADGGELTLFVTQGGTFAATFPGVLWSGGAAPTITPTANKRDVLSFVSDGTSWYGSARQNF